MRHIVIIGGGISGLVVAYKLKRRISEYQQSFQVTLLEKSDRVGGKIKSEASDGFLFEWGPNGFLDNKPLTLELCRDLGLTSELLKSNDSARKRYIFLDNQLHLVPDSPAAFMKSSLMTLKGKLRTLMEPLINKKQPGDETLADFTRRRLGPEVLDKLIAPMVSGVYAGDPEKLSLRSCFPRINVLERDYGSLVKGMVNIQIHRRQGAMDEDEYHEPAGGPSGPAGTLTSFKKGLETLPQKLNENLKDEIKTGCHLKSLAFTKNNTWKVNYSDATGEHTIDADAVCTAIPSFQTANLIESFDTEISFRLNEIPYPPVVVVGLGFNKDDVINPLDGFGFLVPHLENRQILGTLWSSSIFQHRAPESKVLLRTMVGGARNQGIYDKDDKAIIETVYDELDSIIGLKGEPVYSRIVRHKRAIPQYTTGHAQRMVEVYQFLKKWKGLFLGGNAYHGISLNDCVLQGNLTADKILQYLKVRPPH